MRDPDVALPDAHRYFAAHCFNTAWSILEREGRTPEDDEQMIHTAHASLWHWTQRADATTRNLAIGYWQLARIYATTGRAGEARRYAARCLAYSQDAGPFYLGYAHEALARAELLAGEHERARAHLEQAAAQAALVADPDERAQLLADLAALGA